MYKLYSKSEIIGVGRFFGTQVYNMIGVFMLFRLRNVSNFNDRSMMI